MIYEILETLPVGLLIHISARARFLYNYCKSLFREVKRYSLLQSVMFFFSLVLLIVLYLLAALKPEILQ